MYAEPQSESKKGPIGNVRSLNQLVVSHAGVAFIELCSHSYDIRVWEEFKPPTVQEADYGRFNYKVL